MNMKNVQKIWGGITITMLFTVLVFIPLVNASVNDQSGSQGSNSVDLNNNGIPDGQEDSDDDGILNKDDEDYEKSYENIKDDDGDGIPNKDDEDYEKPLDGSHKPDNVGKGNGVHQLDVVDGEGTVKKNKDNEHARKAENYKKYSGSFIDTNSNGIPDGQEDWDDDGVLNRDDSDFEKEYQEKAMLIDTNFDGTPDGEEDWDHDGVLNKDDVDFAKYFLKKGIMNANRQFTDESKIKNKVAVNYLLARGVINGHADGSFSPESGVNRAEAVKIILEVLDSSIYLDAVDGFSDVPENEWYSAYVLTAMQDGIVKGYSDGTFKPNKTVNKVELLKMLFHAFGIDLTDYPVTDLYIDADLNDWYASYLQYAKDNNLIEADKNGKIKPNQSMTRDDFSEVVYLLLQQQESL